MPSTGTEVATEYAAEELLASDRYDEPLTIAGRRYHGGFVDGRYVSPRGLNRRPAIDAWRARVIEQSGMEPVDCPPELFADFYPNAKQARYLLSEGVRRPIIEAVTNIGTVEGFGSMIRYAPVPDLQAHFVEPVTGTAMAHLGRGLFEAHARDESGHEDEGGHQQMWWGARDLAFENPEVGDPLKITMRAMRAGDDGGQSVMAMAKSLGGFERVVPAIDAELEAVITRMAGLLLIERLATNVFAWGIEVLGDSDHCADADQAGALVSYVRTDEEPHVGYLSTVLTEMRARTFVDTEGRHVPGTQVIDTCWQYSLRQMFGEGGKRSQRRSAFLQSLEHALKANKKRSEILASFHDLETPDPVIEEVGR